MARERPGGDGGSGGGPPKPSMPRGVGMNVAFLVLALLAVLVARDYWAGRDVDEISYSEFQRLLSEGAIEKIVSGPEQISGTLRTADGVRAFRTYPVDPELAERLTGSGVELEGEPARG